MALRGGTSSSSTYRGDDRRNAPFATSIRNRTTRLVKSLARPLRTKTYRPLVDFMVVGGQKCGTSALHRFLSQHPEVGMAKRKELHVFDDLDLSRRPRPQEIDERYRPHFETCQDAKVRGEATPIYLYWPGVPQALADYNPKLKVIVLIRDPVARAISHYRMEAGRGDETLPLWLALLLEPIRLRCGERSRRHHSYRARGLFSLQLQALQRCFDSQQLLVLRTEDLLCQHDDALRRVFEFLGVTADARVPSEVVFASPKSSKHRTVGWFLRFSYLAEFIRLRRWLRAYDEPGHAR